MDKARVGGRSSGALADALWLAGKEIRRSWLSYPASAIFTLVLGFLIVPSLSGMATGGEAGGTGGIERAFGSFLADYLFLIVGLILCVNGFSRDYLVVWSADPFSSRLAFLRSLPIPPRTIVAGRMFSMLFTLPFTLPAFFVPVYLFSDLRAMGASYLWFVGIWVGYGLFGAGLTLLMELGLNGKTYTMVTFAMVVPILVIVAILEFTVQLRLVERTIALAGDYGPLPAIVSLVAGAGLFALLARLTARRIERRDLSA
ncbi:hypothetical protein Rxycam_01685 [Rubrobacter xylanophilus DSM 9941]|uniref:hypothetical protein n=1 Tax=Rubrobacter xylanophilus TaxID=49319 RepID=UPI001C64170C|nr:hypothetical protein [Rubrobacter xylanophilus]QYJ15857.1 hypothetical protein Rxycam_01685 [Rubrobacter xylanophilus DSM 9941]